MLWLFPTITLCLLAGARSQNTCPNGQAAVGACINNQCGGGAVCVNGALCCLNGGTTNTGTCPYNRQAVGTCINGLCGAGFVCRNNQCCPCGNYNNFNRGYGGYGGYNRGYYGGRGGGRGRGGGFYRGKRNAANRREKRHGHRGSFTNNAVFNAANSACLANGYRRALAQCSTAAACAAYSGACGQTTAGNLCCLGPRSTTTGTGTGTNGAIVNPAVGAVSRQTAACRAKNHGDYISFCTPSCWGAGGRCVQTSLGFFCCKRLN